MGSSGMKMLFKTKELQSETQVSEDKCGGQVGGDARQPGIREDQGQHQRLQPGRWPFTWASCERGNGFTRGIYEDARIGTCEKTAETRT